MTGGRRTAPEPSPLDREDGGSGGEDVRGRRPDDDAEEPACDLCGGPVLERHCKIVCLNCGYERDCSDP